MQPRSELEANLISLFETGGNALKVKLFKLLVEETSESALVAVQRLIAPAAAFAASPSAPSAADEIKADRDVKSYPVSLLYRDFQALPRSLMECVLSLVDIATIRELLAVSATVKAQVIDYLSNARDLPPLPLVPREDCRALVHIGRFCRSLRTVSSSSPSG